MNKDIKSGDILKYQKEYLSDVNNTALENDIYENGLENACLDKVLVKNTSYKFNIQISETKMYDQKDGYECNIYAFLRMIKSIMKKEGTNIKGLDLSATYIDFYDKLEKVNTFYNEL